MNQVEISPEVKALMMTSIFPIDGWGLESLGNPPHPIYEGFISSSGYEFPVDDNCIESVIHTSSPNYWKQPSESGKIQKNAKGEILLK